jgi:hypothetical protein
LDPSSFHTCLRHSAVKVILPWQLVNSPMYTTLHLWLNQHLSYNVSNRGLWLINLQYLGHIAPGSFSPTPKSRAYIPRGTDLCTLNTYAQWNSCPRYSMSILHSSVLSACIGWEWWKSPWQCTDRGHDVKPLSDIVPLALETSRFIPWTVNTVDFQILSSKPQKSKTEKWKNAKKRGFYFYWPELSSWVTAHEYIHYTGP